MFALIALLVIGLYAWAVYAAFKIMQSIFNNGPQQTKFVPWFVPLVGIGWPLWYFQGYKLSESYKNFPELCAQEQGPHIVEAQPVSILYAKECRMALKFTKADEYNAVECYNDKGFGKYLPYKYLRLTKGASADYECDSDSDSFIELENRGCLRISEVEAPVSPYTRVRAVTHYPDEKFFLSDLVAFDDQYVLPDGTLVAYRRSLRFYPQGRYSSLFGTLGTIPSRHCNLKRGSVSLSDVFPSTKLPTSQNSPSK